MRKKETENKRKRSRATEREVQREREREEERERKRERKNERESTCAHRQVAEDEERGEYRANILHARESKRTSERASKRASERAHTPTPANLQRTSRGGNITQIILRPHACNRERARTRARTRAHASTHARTREFAPTYTTCRG